MNKKVSPIAWRLGYISHGVYGSVWSSHSKDYALSSTLSVKLYYLIHKIMPFTLTYKLTINQDIRSLRIVPEIPSAQSLEGGQYLRNLSRACRRLVPGWKIAIDVVFNKRNVMSAHLIAYDIKAMIERRQSVVNYVNQSLKRAGVDNQVVGLRVVIQGRFKASARKQKVLYNVGSVPIQSISERIEYAKREIHGKYGLSTVRVWLYKNVW